MIVIVAFISPYRTERELARDLFEPGEFVEIYVDTPLDECERRDVKGLYAKARRGELKNFTGIDSAYEAAGGAGDPPANVRGHAGSLRRSDCRVAAVVVWQCRIRKARIEPGFDGSLSLCAPGDGQFPVLISGEQTQVIPTLTADIVSAVMRPPRSWRCLFLSQQSRLLFIWQS